MPYLSFLEAEDQYVQNGHTALFLMIEEFLRFQNSAEMSMQSF